MAAHKNHAASQYYLGRLYYCGLGTESDRDIAMQWYKKALNNGFSQARFEIGEIYYNELGYNNQTDYKKAIHFLQEVDDENEIPSCRYIARMFFAGGYRIKKDYEQALIWYFKQEDIPSEEDYLTIATIYAEGGYGVEKDFKAAEHWSLKSKWSEGFVILGNIYFQGGYGIEKSYITAYDYWSECYGSDKAYSMGIFYTLRDDDEQDFKKALTWFKQSGDYIIKPKCQVLAGLLYEKGLGVTQDYVEAMFWYKTACLKSYGDAFVHVARLYHHGLGVPQDFTKAFELYEQVLDNEKSNLAHKYRAMAGLGLLYKDGNGVPQSYTRAIEYFQKAADGGGVDGCKFMGDIYKNGHGVDIDYEKAFQYYLKCDEACHNSMAMCDEGWLNLGIMYLNGLGTDVNKELALVYMKKALKYGNVEASTYIDQIINDLDIENTVKAQSDTDEQYPFSDENFIDSDPVQSPKFFHVDNINAIILEQEQIPTSLYVDEQVKKPLPLEGNCGNFLYMEVYKPDAVYPSPAQL